MEENNIQSEINNINKKLDIILEEIELQRSHRRQIEDLKDDLMRVGKDLYETAVEELEEVHDEVTSGDILFLGKKLLRNVNNLTRTFELMENARGFLEDFTPVSREIVFDIMNKLDEYDKKGYFEFARELENIADNVVSSFSSDDVRALADNVVTILNTIKNLTQPDMLTAINNAVEVYEKLDIEVDEEVSYWTLFRRMNTPEMRRGVAFGIKFLKSLAEHKSETEKNKIKQINNN